MQTEPSWTPLWTDAAPYALGTGDEHTPSIRYFPPTAEAKPAAMLIFPGGGYQALADHEGIGYATWLAAQGYHAFELRYRLAPHGYRHPAMWTDATRAMRTVRSRGEELGFDKVGVIGSSAGGHLAAHLTVKNDGGNPNAEDAVERFSSRPSASVLCYPVISMLNASAHSGSRANLLGEKLIDEVMREVSPELHVSSNTPPCFVWHTVEDAVVDMENSVMFAMALRRAAVPFDLHIYEKGVHGIGLANGHPWTVECERWLKDQLLDA